MKNHSVMGEARQGMPLIVQAARAEGGYDLFHLSGYNSDIDVGGPEAIWEGGGQYTGFNAFADEVVEVFSDAAADTDAAGNGARKVGIFGLDGSGAEVMETVNLDGVNPVNTVNSYMRVNGVEVTDTGNTDMNAGTITVRQSVTVANVFALMQPMENRARNAVFTVPAGKIAIVKRWGGGIIGPNAGQLQFEVTVAQDHISTIRDMAVVGDTVNPNFDRVMPLGMGPFPGLTDLGIAAAASANNLEGVASFEVLVFDA